MMLFVNKHGKKKKVKIVDFYIGFKFTKGMKAERSEESHVFFLPQDDVQLWLSHVAFCKKWVCKDLITCLQVR